MIATTAQHAHEYYSAGIWPWLILGLGVGWFTAFMYVESKSGRTPSGPRSTPHARSLGGVRRVVDAQRCLSAEHLPARRPDHVRSAR